MVNIARGFDHKITNNWKFCRSVQKQCRDLPWIAEKE
jgi:hypothetical protein